MWTNECFEGYLAAFLNITFWHQIADIQVAKFPNSGVSFNHGMKVGV